VCQEKGSGPQLEGARAASLCSVREEIEAAGVWHGKVAGMLLALRPGRDSASTGRYAPRHLPSRWLQPRMPTDRYLSHMILLRFHRAGSELVADQNL